MRAYGHNARAPGTYPSGPRALYVVTVRHASGAEDPSFSAGEYGDTSLDVAQRAAQVLHGPAYIRVFDREAKQTSMFRRTAAGTVEYVSGGARMKFPAHAPNSFHRERISSVLGGASDPGAGTPIANPDEVERFAETRYARHGSGLWEFQFGAYGDTHLYVWADGMGSGFEIAVEWLDDHAPGMLTMVSEEDYQQAAEELGKVWDPSDPDDEIMQTAEADMTMIGHTTLKHGNAVASWEWTVREVTTSAAFPSDEWNEVVERSREEE